MRKIIAFMLCIIMIMSLAACGGNDNQTPSENPVSEAHSDAEPAAEPSPEKDENSEITALEEKYAGLTEDELTWEYNSSTKTIIISGKGPMRDYFDEAPEWDGYNSEAVNVIIGDEVTSIGAFAFYCFDALTDVKLGSSVEFIDSCAFDNCISLRSVNFPENLKYIGNYAFNNDLLHSDSGFSFPEGMLYLGNSSFRSAFKESFVSIPASLTTIETTAFDNCFVEEFRVDAANTAYASVDGIFYDKNIETLINYPADKKDTIYEIPETVTTVLKEAIQVTNRLEKIVIPAGTTVIEEKAIFWNYALSSIEVDENNQNYMSVDGVLFTNDGKKLLCYPLADNRTEYTLPAGCEKICDFSMSSADNLTEIHTNEDLKEIGECGLYNCRSLKKLGLPKSLVKIGLYGLTFCDSLTRIDYLGSAEDWKKVEIGENNELLTDGRVTVYCAE